MAALVKACEVSTSIKNTGVGCSSAMGPVAQLLMVPPGLKWTTSDMIDFPAYVNRQMHAAPSARIYPIFGYNAPIVDIQSNDSDDVYEDLPNGSRVFIRSGYANRTFDTTKGGLCYAAALRSFIGSGYSFVEIDATGQIAMKKNADGTYSGFPAVEAGGTTPKAATFTTVYKNSFTYSYDPTSYINNGSIFKGADAILDYMGLLDTQLTSGGAKTGTIASVAIGAGGTGYTNGTAVTFTGGGGTGAAGTILVTAGAITGVTVTNPGSGYTSAPGVSFTGGSGATGTAAVSYNKLLVNVTAECTGDDLVALLSAVIADPDAFVVTDVNGANVTVSGAAISNGHVLLTITGQLAASFPLTVDMAIPSILYDNDIEGYENKETLSVAA